jgi:hypothetical protein
MSNHVHERHVEDGLPWLEGCARCHVTPPGADIEAQLRAHWGDNAPLVLPYARPGVRTMESHPPLTVTIDRPITLHVDGGALEGYLKDRRLVEHPAERLHQQMRESTEGKGLRLYVAGVISGDDRPFEVKRDELYARALHLQAAGFDTLVPLDIANDLCTRGPGACGESTARRLAGKDQGAGHSWECYLRHDLIEMLRCDGVALPGNWHRSPGARLESQTAHLVGMDVRLDEEWLAVLPTTGIFTGTTASPKTTKCVECGEKIRMNEDGAWLDDEQHGPGAPSICLASKDPDPVHVPPGKPQVAVDPAGGSTVYFRALDGVLIVDRIVSR